MKTRQTFIGKNRLWRLSLIMVVFFSVTGFHLAAQKYTLRLNVINLKANTRSADTIYVAGNFNDWNPGNDKFQLTKIPPLHVLNSDDPGVAEATWGIDVHDLKAGTYEFKFTRGDWSKVEVNPDGSGINNRVVELISDTTIEYNIDNWRDDFSLPEKQHTANLHVQLLDSTFFISQLNRTVRIWIYLPEGYATPKNKTRYPVLYMNDGQNVFDEYFSGFGEWGVDECLDSLIENGRPPCIVVAVEAGANRINEYSPYDMEKYGEGQGDAYVDFLANTLKPFIDKHYRTLPASNKTIIAGSSMGGLLSYYALLAHPDIFGKAGVFSPSFWVTPQINQFTDSVGSKVKGKIFFYMGRAEGNKYVDDMNAVADNIGKRSGAIIYTVIDPDGRHNEQAWRKWFAEFYCWITGNGFNSPVKIEKD